MWQNYFNTITQAWLIINTPFSQLFFGIFIKFICILVAVAYFTIAERKAMAAIQRRKGPNVIGFWGLLQPLADGAKLLLKELLIPTRSNAIIFLIAPLMVLILSIVGWVVVPSIPLPNTSFGLSSITQSHIDSNLIQPFLSPYISLWGLIDNINLLIKYHFHHFSFHSILWTMNSANLIYGILFILVVSGLNVYGIIIAGWASNSKYAFLGSLRSSAQMISYEVSLSLLILPVIFLAGSLNFGEIVMAQQKFGWFVFPLLPCAILFGISMLAETNRAPFDLPEAEAELVAGYNVEYSSIIFAMFFLGEYSNMLLMATVMVLLFFGGWLAPFASFSFFSEAFYFSFKVIIMSFLFILIRAALPRFRYDQLMDLGWKSFLPFSLSFLIFTVGMILTFDSLPMHKNLWDFVYTENLFFNNF